MVKVGKSYTPGKAIASNRQQARGGLRVDYASILNQRIRMHHEPSGEARPAGGRDCPRGKRQSA